MSSYKTYAEAREDWIPTYTTVIAEYTDDPFMHLVIHVWDNHLSIDRFFPLGDGWEVSGDYRGTIEDLAAMPDGWSNPHD